MMKKPWSTLLRIVTIYAALQGATAQVRPFGIGVIVGEPMGVNGKMWINDAAAVVGSIGWSVGGDRIGRDDSYDHGRDRWHVHIDYLWHSFAVFNMVERYPVYAGIGARINSGAAMNASLAIRGVIGVAWLPLSVPIDFFMELIPMAQVSSSKGFGLDAGVGIRYFIP
ncbi:MAG: hypothetical protein WCW35_01790 [Bacteroidota bacterium]|jgi:hypothetical protein